MLDTVKEQINAVKENLKDPEYAQQLALVGVMCVATTVAFADGFVRGRKYEQKKIMKMLIDSVEITH